MPKITIARSLQAVLFLLASMAALLLVQLAVAPSPAAESKHPNIVFILTDDQRLEDIAHMPNLKRLLIDQGVLFDHYFSTVSLCCPSRTSILRGQYAHNTGVMTNGSTNGGFETAHRLGVENSTIATWLQDHNYKTALIGKYLNHYPGRLGPGYVPPGWDYWASAVAGNPYGEYNYTLNENGKAVQYGHNPEDYGTDVYTRKAVDFIKSSAKQHAPFFLYLAFYAPHGPATPAPRHAGMFADAKVQRSKAFNEADVSKKPMFIQKLSPLTEQEINAEDQYYGKRLSSLQAVDEAIDTVYKTLADTKQLDNTYIVFASDNGFHLGEHRMRRGKQTAYETDVHLPLIVRGPGVRHGTKIAQLAGNIDLAPTFADIAGAQVPAFVDGRSLLPLLHEGEETAAKWRQVFLLEHWTARPNKDGGAAGANNPEARLSIAGSDDQTKVFPDVLLHNSLQEEADELAQGAPAASVASQVGNDHEPSARTAPRKGRRARRRRRRAGGEFAGIPELHALRGADSTYVEYVTGERELYELREDPDQVENLIPGADTRTLQRDSARLGQLEKSASADARALENAK